MTVTALIVAVPEAESVVGGLRRKFDPTALAGVPAHVTVLVPFVDGEEIRASDLDLLRSLFARTKVFSYSFGRVGRFRDATYLAPSDPAPFVQLTRSVVEAFPAYPPYSGAFQDIVPHLTVARGAGPGLDEAAEALEAWRSAHPAFHGQCREVLLLEQQGDRWHVVQGFSLAHSDT